MPEPDFIPQCTPYFSKKCNRTEKFLHKSQKASPDVCLFLPANFYPMARRISLYVIAFLSLVIMCRGLMYLIRIHIMNYHIAYLGMTEDQLSAVDQKIVPLYLTLMKITCACMLAIGATSLVITWSQLRNGTPWGWWSLITLLPFPLVITTVLTYHVASEISLGPRPPYWLAAGILILFLGVIGFCYPRKDR